ncbi:hypothetical protein [Bradyrhizobium sp.]|uniref:hypothetical protein n=1 Tax=Bradyrhizobium sp. TaxID=376 RepID=UPI0040376822
MARDSNHRGGYEAEDSGGLFSSLFADEDDCDRRRTLWRVASWGVISVVAVVGAVMANQSSIGWRREQAATADLVQQANRLQAVARDSQNEARRLASAVETLNGDRDRLYTRVTVLEQGLDSVTGAIARQNAAAAAPAEAQPAAQPAAPAIEPVASKPAAQPEKTSATASAEPAPASTSAVKEVPTRPAAMPATPLVESKSMMAPPDPAAGKLIEPAKPASAITAEAIPIVAAAAPFGDTPEKETADAALPKIQRTEFGVDVGGANSIAGLRALWKGLLKSRANAPLALLQPIIVIREGSGGRGMQLRLVAGPLSDAAAAAKLCAVMTENDRDCETAVYDGQRLTLKADEAPAAKPAAPPPASRKKNAPQKRAAAAEEPKKPETSSGWSSFFGKKN